MTLVFQILGVLLFLFFCFATYMCSKTWRIWHVISSFLVFCACVAFVVLLSLELKTRTKWMNEYQNLEERLTKVRAENEDLWNGKRDDAGNYVQGVYELYNAVQREVLDRGRVWRKCTINGSNVDQTVVKEIRFLIPTAPPENDPNAIPGDNGGGAQADPNAAQPAAAQGAAPDGHGINQDQVVHVFEDGQWEDAATQLTLDGLPRFYLGEFKVTAVTGNEVTLVPTLPVQTTATPNVSNTWTIYEILPLDSREAFAGLSQQQLESLLNNSFYQLPPPVFEATLRAYERDGQAATDEDPPLNVWTKVVFKGRHTVDVDSEIAATALQGEFFDPAGRAIMAKLRRGETVEITEGMEGLFLSEDAEDLAARGLVELGENIFRRTLNDYEYSFRSIHQQNETLLAMVAAIDQNVATVTESTQQGMQQIQVRQQEQQKLESDKARFSEELAEITAYHVLLQQQYEQLRSRLYDLYTENLRMAQELAAISERMTREIDEKTRQAVESDSPRVESGT